MSTIRNDDYCDLEDGSDETRTAACSHTKVQFSCLNLQCVSITLPTSRVNDGVCDCGDGVDEWDRRYTQVVCPIHCSSGHMGAEALDADVPAAGSALALPSASAMMRINGPSHLRSGVELGADEGRHKIFLPVDMGITYELYGQIAVLFVLILACVSYLCVKMGGGRIVRKSSSRKAGGNI